MTRALEDVLRDVETSGVLPDFDGKAWLSSLPDESRPTDGEQFAKELVRRKVLTKYQAEQIYSGRGKALALGNYVVLDKLGQGGMGMVLKAEHRRMGRVVAIKVMSPAGMKSPDAVKRFQREVQAAAKLEHPHIVTAYDADESGGMHFLVMQYVDGTDLQVHVKRHGPLPVERAVHCIVQAARGLAFAHEQGVIHRDIKPANLLLDSKGTVRILDMGLARIEGAVGGGVENAGLTSSGMIMGTVDFMSPEQAIDTKRADARSDIYSLGCTLYYLLTGRTIYDDDTVMKRLMAHQQKAIPSLVESVHASGSQQKSGSSQSADSAVASAEAPISLPAELTALDAVFRRLVAKKPEDRPQTMTEVIAELEGCLTGSSSSLTLAGSGGLSGSSGLSSVSRSQLSGSVTGAISDSKVAITEDSAFSETMISSAGEAATDPQILVTGGSQDRWKKRHSSSSGTSSAWWKDRRVQIGAGLAAMLFLTAIVFAITRNGAEQTGVVSPDAGQSAKNSPKGNSSANTGNAGLAGQQALSSEASPPDVPAPAVADAGPPVAKFPFDAKRAQAHQQAWADYLRVPVEFTNGLGMRFRLIPPGEFQMGLGPEFTDDEFKRLTGLTREQDLNRLRASRPAHPVRITRPFYMQVDEVTSGHYQNIMGQLRPEMEQDPNKVLTEWVAWPDAISFCNGLSEREGRQPAYRIDGTQITVIDDANGYRLPTEAQWEYACRAGTDTLWYFGAEASADIRTFRNQASAPNPFGLTALYGGANEWCWDATNLDPYSVVTPGPHIDPRIDAGSMRIKRGGGNQDGSGANRFLVNSFARAKISGGPYGSKPMHISGFGRVVLPLSEPAKLPAPSDSAVIPPQTTKAIDLLALVDPGLDVVSGAWRRDGAGFISDLLSTNNYLRLPVEPGEAFSLRIAFSTNRGNFSVVLPLESKGLELFVSVGKIELCLKPPKTPTNSVFAPSKPVNDDQRHELVIDVTRPADDEVRMQVQVDGQPAVDWRGTRGQLADISGRYAAETSLGISTFLPVLAPTRLLSAELTTTRGTARFLRPLPVASQPPLAKAPFDAGQARAHQEAWARHLGTQVETTNSVGQKMILIPPGEFLMGSTDAQVEAALKADGAITADQWLKRQVEVAERPQHNVVITRPFWMSATEVTVGQFKKFAAATGYVTEAEKAEAAARAAPPVEAGQPKRKPIQTYLNPGYVVTDDFPAAVISWNDATAYCQWLSSQEKRTWRLPTEAEWEYSCRAGTTTQYSSGDDSSELPRYAWHRANANGKSHPVGTLLPNPFGLFDMHGNLFEWCGDYFGDQWYAASPQNDPNGPSASSFRVIRGGDMYVIASRCRSAFRNYNPPSNPNNSNGFRCVSVIDVSPSATRVAPTSPVAPDKQTTSGTATSPHPATTSPPSPAGRSVGNEPTRAVAPFDARAARSHQEAWVRHLDTQVETTNSVGQKLILIPPGEFLMGSTDAQIEAALKAIDDEGANPAARDRIQKAERPQHKVVITRPYLMSSTEVTIGQFKKFSATGYVTEAEKASKLDPGYRTYLSDGADDLPAAFLSWTDVVAYCQWLSTQEAKTYRLPTEAEWEYACRAGTTTQYSFGDDERELPRYGWYDKNSAGRSHPVGTLLANNFGLFDMHGSVSEWCQDRFNEDWYAASPQNDPFVSSGGSGYAVRGGYWSNPRWVCRSANRNSVAGVYRLPNYGFRVVAEIDVVQTRSSVSAPVPPAGVTPSPTPAPAGPQP